MAYTVLARRWRPQRFEDVIGQEAVTRTLQNALRQGRVAPAFIFSGPRGVGKTTTARILARALNCERGPTVDPCGQCDACREIAEGRDIDVLEIDAATHTGVDNVREVIIDGLSIPPVRDRNKIFVIDEVHQLSTSSFNALLKSIEEPPPHVAFIMATTDLHKVPDTILSRVQVFEFRTISTRAIADQLRKIAASEKIAIDDQAIGLVARAAEGSMRDAQTALDQVLAFAGDSVTVDDVSTVLGLVGRDLLLQMVEAVADERAEAAFELPARSVEAGHDLRQVVRELSRVVRDLLVLSVDPERLKDPEVAPEGERDRLKALASRFSREDLLRGFDLLARAELDIRSAPDPRYHLELLLLRWIHTRKLVPLVEIIESLEQGGAVVPPRAGGRPAPPAEGGPRGSGTPPVSRAPSSGGPAGRSGSLGTRSESGRSGGFQPPVGATPASAREGSREGSGPEDEVDGPAVEGQAGELRDAFFAEIKRAKAVFYRMVVAQAQRIQFEADRVVFAFSPAHKLQKEQVEQNRTWLESLAGRLAGRKVRVTASSGPKGEAEEGAAAGAAGETRPERAAGDASDLKTQAMADAGLKELAEVFPIEIRDVEKI
jgi:DNA polymerase III subunit gamma/tau